MTMTKLQQLDGQIANLRAELNRRGMQSLKRLISLMDGIDDLRAERVRIFANSTTKSEEYRPFNLCSSAYDGWWVPYRLPVEGGS